MLDALGRGISRHPWVVIGLWIIGVVLALGAAFGGIFGQPLFDRLTTGAVSVPGQTQDGDALIARYPEPADTQVLLVLDNITNTSSRVKRAIADARDEIRMTAAVASVQDPYAKNSNLYDADSIPLLSQDQRAIMVVVTLKHGISETVSDQAVESVTRVLDKVAPKVPGSVGYVGGTTLALDEVTTQVEKDLTNGEGTALPISFAIMIIVFGGILAAMLPIIGAIAAIAGAMATLLGFSYLIELDSSTVNVVTVLGLGLCIDYGLLLVSRYREEMVRLPGDPQLPPTRRQRELALSRTMSSAGRTVLFSGITVAISLTGLMLFRANFLKAIGAAGVSVVAVAVLVALTLVPALLAVVKVRMIRPGLVHRIPVVGRFVRKLGDVAPEEGAFSKLARFVQRYPVIVLMAVLSALFVMSLPVLRMELSSSEIAQLPKDNEQRQLFDNIQARFPVLAKPTIEVVADTSAKRAQSLANTIKTLPAVVSVGDPNYRGTTNGTRVTTIAVTAANSPGSPTARELVREIRSLQPGYRTWTTGTTSALIDYEDDLHNRAPYALLVVILATFVLLFLMTGSVLVPIKALLMNVVSLGASLGVLVWVFQDGNLESFLSFTSTGGVETFIPPLTLAFGFGLAMDYEVFLLSRIAEHRRRGFDNDESVELGLQRSGRIITSAAIIVIVVFAGFIAGKLLIIKETGLALAVAVAVDASLVRMLLVPATMTLLGELNWWAPPFLRRLHDRYGLSESDD